MLRRFLFAALVSLPLAGNATPFAEVFPETYAELPAEYQEVLGALDLKTGTIILPGGKVQLDVPEDYYYLNVEDARTVLEVLWDNPESPGVLGMLFPREYSPIDYAGWGIEISFDAIGYVSDEDAASYDYDELLVTMQSDIREENEWRLANGYDAMELVGWAAEPRYDQTTRKLHWAKELHFGTVDSNTLNYNIRALGRHGVLMMNFIADMDSLQEIEGVIPNVMNMVSYTEGNRYSDFQPGVDKVAAVGIGGLIAGKVLAKSGLLAVALVFLKKAWFLLFLPFIWLKNLVSGRRS